MSEFLLVKRELLELIAGCRMAGLWVGDGPEPLDQLRAVLAQEAGRGEPVGVLMLGEVFHGTKGPELDDWDVDWYRKPIDELNAAHPGAQLKLYTSPPAPVSVVHPFADKVISKLQRFEECASDSGADGVDIGRHWLDLLTQLGLLNRVQRSPALWEITQQGEDVIDKVKELNQ